MKNEFQWPKHWRRSIFKIESVFTLDTNGYRYKVTPKNPEWFKEATKPWDALTALPPMTLDTIEFDSIEELDQWAQVVARFEES